MQAGGTATASSFPLWGGKKAKGCAVSLDLEERSYFTFGTKADFPKFSLKMKLKLWDYLISKLASEAKLFMNKTIFLNVIKNEQGIINVFVLLQWPPGIGTMLFWGADIIAVILHGFKYKDNTKTELGEQ